MSALSPKVPKTPKSPSAPLAYQTGRQDFYGRDFFVTPDVLIPRPETEQLIDAVLNLAGKPYLPGVLPSIRKLPKNPKILDVGTGSGCIAITLKLELPEADISAVDFSAKSLLVAEKNAKALGAKITFKNSDLLEKVDFTPDLIVANLPYVDTSWDWLDKTALSYEPDSALYAEDGGLFLIKKLIDESANRKIPFLVLEADPCQHMRIINYATTYQLLETRGFCLVFTLRNPQASH